MGWLPSPGSPQPAPVRALPSKLALSRAFAIPNYPMNPHSPSAGFWGVFRIHIEFNLSGQLEEIPELSSSAPTRPWTLTPQRQRGCMGVWCPAYRSATATLAGMAPLGIGGGRSLFQKLPFLFVVGLQRPGRGLRNWRVRVSKRSQGDSPPTRPPLGPPCPKLLRKRPLASDVSQERWPQAPWLTHWISPSRSIRCSGQRRSQLPRCWNPRYQTTSEHAKKLLI